MASVGKYALLSLDEARDYLKVTDTTNDARIASFVDLVTAAIEVYTARKLLSRTYDGGSGNEPTMILNGNGSHEIAFREIPVTAVTQVVERYSDGSTTRTLNISGLRLLHGGRRMSLPFDFFTCAQNNIEVKCTAGYLAGTHDSEVRALKLAAMRYLQVAYQDRELALARGQTFGVGDNSVSMLPDDLPRDVKMLLRPFERWF